LINLVDLLLIRDDLVLITDDLLLITDDWFIIQTYLFWYVQMTANVTAEVRVYRKYYRDVVAIVRKVGW